MNFIEENEFILVTMQFNYNGYIINTHLFITEKIKLEL